MYSSVEWCEQDRALHLAAWQRLVESARPGASVQIRGAEHRTFMDWRLLPLRRWSIGRLGHATIDGTRMWAATSRSLLALFDRHLKGEPAPTFEALAGELEELVVASPAELFAPLGTPEGAAPPWRRRPGRADSQRRGRLARGRARGRVQRRRAQPIHRQQQLCPAATKANAGAAPASGSLPVTGRPGGQASGAKASSRVA